MATTWVLVAHRGGARIFENRGPGKGLRLLQELSHDPGRLYGRDVDSDRPGRAQRPPPARRHGRASERERFGVQRHQFSREESPAEHSAVIFARELAEVLGSARTRNRYDRLVLAADPRFLGMIRDCLDAPTAAKITATLNKDLAKIDPKDLPRYLGEVMAV